MKKSDVLNQKLALAYRKDCLINRAIARLLICNSYGLRYSDRNNQLEDAIRCLETLRECDSQFQNIVMLLKMVQLKNRTGSYYLSQKLHLQDKTKSYESTIRDSHLNYCPIGMIKI